MFWVLFVVGYDCGYGFFLKYKWVNNLVGYLCYIFIFVLFYGWCISYRIYYVNIGNIEIDESWYLVFESKYNMMFWYEKLFCFYLLLLVYFFYLFKRLFNCEGFYFVFNSFLFCFYEKLDVLISLVLWMLMVGFFGCLIY